MIQGKFMYDTDDLSEINHIYEMVFGATTENCEQEESQKVYVIVSEQKKNVAIGTLERQKEVYKIQSVAVVKEEQHKGYGDFVVRMLMDKAYTMGAVTVEVEAPQQFVEFFEKIGFKATKRKDDVITFVIRQQQICKQCETK